MRLLATSLWTLLLMAVPAWAQTATPTPPPPEQISRPMRMYPLPGALDRIPVFNSNSPEMIDEEGILLSTLPPDKTDKSGVHLDFAFKNKFAVFTHHITKDEKPGARAMYIGLLAFNRGDKPVTIKRLQGASYLAQPDAIFKPMDALVPNLEGKAFSGPGSRVATELMMGLSPLPQEVYTIPPGGSAVLYNWHIPTTVEIPPPINGRSTLIKYQTDAPVYLAEMALYARKDGMGKFIPPTQEDFIALMNQNKLAGPREIPPTPFDPGQPPSGSVFRYGRVAGVSEGDRWMGSLFLGQDVLNLPKPGETVGFPIASLYVKRFGTTQNQSAQMLRRYPDTAYQAHGNYGVTYDLRIPLNNPDKSPRIYQFKLSWPAFVKGQSPNIEAVYFQPPGKPTMFRGSAIMEWLDAQQQPQRQWVHLVMHQGEEMPAFATVEVPAKTRYVLSFYLLYPADATPPQLLAIERLK